METETYPLPLDCAKMQTNFVIKSCSTQTICQVGFGVTLKCLLGNALNAQELILLQLRLLKNPTSQTKHLSPLHHNPKPDDFS